MEARPQEAVPVVAEVAPGAAPSRRLMNPVNSPDSQVVTTAPPVATEGLAPVAASERLAADCVSWEELPRALHEPHQVPRRRAPTAHHRPPCPAVG